MIFPLHHPLKTKLSIGVVSASAALLLSVVVAASVSQAQAPQPSVDVAQELNVTTFFCKTRYGLQVPGETARREACQKGYDEKACEPVTGDDEDGLAKACENGRLAFHDLNPEPAPDVSTTVASPMSSPPVERRQSAQSGTQSCGNVDTAFLSCQIPAVAGIGGTPLGALLTIILNFLALSVGIVAVGAFVYAGSIYASSRDSEAQVKKAKEIIKNTIIGLVMFVALYAIVEFIIPGGVF